MTLITLLLLCLLLNFMQVALSAITLLYLTNRKEPNNVSSLQQR